MNSLKFLSAAAAVALVIPFASPSFAQQSRAGAVGAGGGAAIGGGGGGGFGGGARMGGGGGAFHGGGGGAAMRSGGGNFAAGAAVRPGGGSFVGGMGSRQGISPSFSGTRGAVTAGNWQGGSGNWSGRHWNHRHHRHGGFWPGFAAGAAIGGIGSYAYYGNRYGYYDDPYYYGYYDEPTVAVVQDGGRDDAYCAQRFKSYDPASGTYLGYDGKRHPCP